ncbi:adenosylcobinamide-phosphate synthase CbiB [Clostridiaceae bacterium HSG29]|nr:adenosylcobinamide-phosphate synthase CbiB [Clostridiaceae bacterium HSG29]
MISIYLGVIMNLLIGQIPFITHPIVHIGNMISFFESKLYDSNTDKKSSGLVLLILVSMISFVVPYMILYVFASANYYLAFLANAVFVLEILAIKGLKDEPLKVYRALKDDDIEKARFELSMLVTRDTSNMDKDQIIMSTIETIAENIVDGVTAPLFYIFLGGAPLGFFYKSVNTLDSMVGYKNDKYSDFGYYSAKFDDVLNYIPARITALFIIIASFLLKYDYKEAIKILKKDRKKSESPNSGYSEAPVAGALNVYFGGKLKYFDKEIEKPMIGSKNEFDLEKIIGAIDIMYMTSFIALGFYSIVIYILR